MQTKCDLVYHNYGRVMTVPAGTRVTPASNLRNGGWWAEAWEGMTEAEESWMRNYGFHVEDAEVEMGPKRLYSAEVEIIATAYVRAHDETEAARLIDDVLCNGELHVTGDQFGLVSELRFDDEDLPDVSLSPAMTILERCDGNIEEAE